MEVKESLDGRPEGSHFGPTKGGKIIKNRIIAVSALVMIALLVVIAIIISGPDNGKDQNQAREQTTQEKPQEKAYGCFRDLRWDMSPDQATKSLKIKIKKWMVIEGKDQYTGEVQIGDREHFISLFFDDNKLCEIWIRPKEMIGSIDSDQAKIGELYEGYQTLKPSLINKYGQPINVVEENHGTDTNILNDLLKQKAILLSEWKTDESSIRLTIEVASHIVSGSTVYNYSPLLMYKKMESSKPKTDKDIEL